MRSHGDWGLVLTLCGAVTGLYGMCLCSLNEYANIGGAFPFVFISGVLCILGTVVFLCYA